MNIEIRRMILKLLLRGISILISPQLYIIKKVLQVKAKAWLFNLNSWTSRDLWEPSKVAMITSHINHWAVQGRKWISILIGSQIALIIIRKTQSKSMLVSTVNLKIYKHLQVLQDQIINDSILISKMAYSKAMCKHLITTRVKNMSQCKVMLLQKLK